MKIQLTNPINAHVHFRHPEDPPIFQSVVPHTARQFAAAIAIGNLKPNAIETAQHAHEYRHQAQLLAPELNTIVAMMITPQTTPEMIEAAAKAGSIVGKLMPQNVSTNTENGYTDLRHQEPLFRAMSEQRMPLLIHAESADPNVHPLDRERLALAMVDRLARAYPDLAISIEHISAKETAEYLRKQAPPNVGASVTYHHLVNTWRNLYNGPYLQSHFHCAPCLKRQEDADAIWDLIASGFDRIWFGSDSAPHRASAKESREAPSGIFTEPFVLPGLVEVFAERRLLHRLDAFVCKNAARWYHIAFKNDRVVTLVAERWSPNPTYDGIFCPYHDLVLHWKVAE